MQKLFPVVRPIKFLPGVNVTTDVVLNRKWAQRRWKKFMERSVIAFSCLVRKNSDKNRDVRLETVA